MRKVLMNLAVSLDGFIEGPQGEYDWCFTDQDYGMTAFMKRIDTVFYGRKSYEMMMRASTDSSGQNSFVQFDSYVFSTTLQEPFPNTKLISTNGVEVVREMKRQKGKDIWLFGGADLLTTFIKEGLVDELSLAIHPLLLGSGKLLFQDIRARVNLRLIDSQNYDSGLVILRYEVTNKKSK